MVVVKILHRFAVEVPVNWHGDVDVTKSSTSSNGRILAFSVAQSDRSAKPLYGRDSFPPRKLCDDRRGFLDHLRPKLFVKNVVRIAVMQSTTVITNYYNDQLKNDIEREDRILRGEITKKEADREEGEWQETEWNQRLESIPRRIAVAFAKYHAIVMVMRFYEHVASKYVDEVAIDKLTMDTFECAKRTARTEEGGKLFNSTLSTCLRANTISFLADYSVHQIILAYGYYLYIQAKKKRIQQNNEDLQQGSLVLSFIHKSALLVFSRVVGLVLSSGGGAVGTLFWPGWGTLAGTNLGDSLALSLTDDVQSPSTE